MSEKLAQLLTNKDAFVSTCSMAAVRMFGLDALDWDPLVLRDALQDELRLKVMPQRLFDRVNCGLSLVGTNGYPTHLEIFVPCNALMSFQPIDEGVMGLDDPYSLAWGVWEYQKLVGEAAEDITFSDDVALYAGQVLYDAGITEPIEWLKWAQYDPVKMENLSQNMMDPTFYASRQMGLNANLKQMCIERNKSLMAQLEELDRLLPVNNTVSAT